MADGEAEDLEYHVTFPTAISTAAAYDTSEDPETLDRREPVVILLGWMGCEDRHLSKYSAIYHSLGYTTVRYMVPTEYIQNTIRRESKLKEIAWKVLELVFDLGLEENVVFFHIFSNGGCFIYRYITQILHDPSLGGAELTSIKVAGCVYDSAPCSKNTSNTIKIINMDKNNGLIAKLCRIIVILLAALLSFIVPSKSSWNFFKYNYEFMSDMKTDPSRYPQLFLYSKTDEICDWRAVDDVVEARRKRLVEVQQVCWEESPHCAHLIAHREEYIQNCQDFVQGCLRSFVDEELKSDAANY